jgi:hypothetical protein
LLAEAAEVEDAILLDTLAVAEAADKLFVVLLTFLLFQLVNQSQLTLEMVEQAFLEIQIQTVGMAETQH